MMAAFSFDFSSGMISPGFQSDIFGIPVRPRNPHAEERKESSDSERRKLQEIEKYSIQDERYENIDEIKSKNLMCPICSCVINGTVAITSCKHKYCSQCLMRHVQSSHSPSCPLCRKELTVNDISLDEEETHYLDNCIVGCKNAECSTEVKRLDYRNHINNCPFNKGKCDDCMQLIYVKDSEKHKEECTFRTSKCMLCKASVRCNELEKHRIDSCPYTQIKCPNEKCRYETQSHKMPRHTLTCNYRTIVCRNGCGLSFELSEELKHSTDSCTMKIIECEYCNVKVQEKNLSTHFSKCTKKPFVCCYCRENINLENSIEHSLVCEERPYFCKCGVEVVKKDKNSHDSICGYRLENCELCLSHIRVKDRLSHIDSCPKKLEKCSDCGEEMYRMNLSAHKNVCSFATVKCKYHYAGCEDVFLRKELEKHMEDNVKQHLTLLDMYIEHHTSILSEYNDSSNEEDEKKERDNILPYIKTGLNQFSDEILITNVRDTESDKDSLLPLEDEIPSVVDNSSLPLLEDEIPIQIQEYRQGLYQRRIVSHLNGI